MACLLVASPIFAEEDYTRTVIIEVQGTKGVLYDRALLWLTETYVSGKDVMQLNDKAAGLIVGRGISRATLFLYTYQIRYLLQIDIKDNKVRFTIKDPVMIFPTNNRGPMMGEEQTVRNTFQSVIDDFTKYMKTAKDKSDW